MALDPSARRRAGMSYCPQERPVFDDLSVRDNLTLMRASRRLTPFRRYFDRFPILERRLNQHAGTLSGGEKKMLSFVRGLAEDQPVVLLDEPSEGVQWENILHMEALIAEKKAAGTAFIIVEQNLAFAERIADRYLVMDQGRVMLEGRAIGDRSQPRARPSACVKQSAEGAAVNTRCRSAMRRSAASPDRHAAIRRTLPCSGG